MSQSATITNPFARTLMFYHLYQRVKLNPTDLAKIAKKYGKKPEAMISDLSRKYSYWQIPDTVTLEIFVRIISVYQIPENYLVLIDAEAQ